MYLQCPTDFSLLWHLTKKNLMVRYFSPCIHLRSTLSESVWKRRVDGCERLCSGDIFPVHQGDCFFFPFSFFFFLDVCSIKQPLNLKKKKNNSPLHTKKKTKTKKHKTSAVLVYCQITADQKKNETAAFHFSTQLARESPPSEPLNKTQKSKDMCTLNVIMRIWSVNIVYFKQCMGLENRTEHHTHTHHFTPDEEEAADTGSERPSERTFKSNCLISLMH